MKSPQLSLFAVLIFATGVFAGKLAFQNPATGESEKIILSQRSTRSQTSRSPARQDFLDRVQRARAQPKAGDREQAMILLLTDMVLTDPAQAVTLLGEVSDLKRRTELAKEAAATWILSDPTAALLWIQDQASSPLKKDIALTMFNKTSARNPLVAKQLFETVPSLNNSHNIRKLAENWARSDFEAAKEYVISQDNPILAKSGILSILEEWGRRDPAAAIARLDGSPDLFAGGYGINYSGLIRGWAQKDPKAAFEYAKGFKPGPAIMAATFSALKAWIKDNPQAAVAAMQSISDKIYPSGQIIEDWAKIDLITAKEWIKNYDHQSKHSGMSAMIRDLAKTDFKKAAELHREFTNWSEDHEPDPEKSVERAGFNLAREWAQHNPDEALAWIDSQPAGETKDTMISTMIGEIGSRLPQKARELAAELPPGELRSSAIFELVRDLKQEGNPTQAFEASQLLIDEQTRLTTTEDVLKRINTSAPQKALELLERAKIPEADRERIRGALK